MAPASPDPHLFAARAFLAAGARPAALAQVRIALHKGADPKDGIAAALWIGRNVDEWLRAVPGTPQAFGWLSDGLWDAGRQREAHQVALAVVDLFGPGAGAVTRAARQALILDAEAARWARAWLAHEPRRGEAHVTLARALERAGDARGARESYAAALKAAPADAETALAAAAFLVAQGQPVQARAALDQARPDPADGPLLARVHAVRAVAFQKEGLPTRALAEYRAAARRAPAVPEHWLAAAQVLADLDRPAEAARELTQGMAQVPPAAKPLLAARLRSLREATGSADP